MLPPLSPLMRTVLLRFDSEATEADVTQFLEEESVREARDRARQVLEALCNIGTHHRDGSTHRVSFNDQSIKLGPTEFKLLNYLMHHAERVHSRSQLLDRVWGDHVFIEERTVDVHVKRLREALGEAGSMVETVRGVGYRITQHT